ncbi:MAG: hypothetical protein FWC89_05815 [Defluviitaleaceae bacterium]|nr:hypothetical protein [Defluviitaleaceae bacterium]
MQNSTNFRDFYNDDNNILPIDKAKIEFEVDLIGKLIDARESKGLAQDKLTIVPSENLDAV